MILGASIIVLGKDSFARPLFVKVHKEYLKLINQDKISEFGGIRSIPVATEGKIDTSTLYYDFIQTRINGERLKDYRHQEIVNSSIDFITSSKALGIGLSVQKKFWETYNSSNKSKVIEQFKLLIGYHDYLEPIAKDCSFNAIKNEDAFTIFDVTCKSRYDYLIKSFIGIPKKEAKGVALAIHGKNSGPDNIIGVSEPDYGKEFANSWLEKGFVVIAPWVNPSHGIDPRVAGLSAPGLDLSNLLDWVEFIKIKYPKETKNMITHGISYGSLLAEYVGIISADISLVISSGGSARGSLLLRAKYGQTIKKPKDYYFDNALRSTLFEGDKIYNLIFPKKLIISIGLRDHANEPKFSIIQNAKSFYKKNGAQSNFRINLHDGAHITDFEGVYNSFLTF
jgi:hypothetical protein